MKNDVLDKLVKSDSSEEILLLTIGHEILNFRPSFPKSSIKHTFILSHYGSGMFGLMPQNKKLYLGVPQRFYELFKVCKLNHVARVKKQAGLFLVMQIGKGNKKHEVAIRIFVRTKRLLAIDEEVTSVRVVPMDKNGITRENDLLQGFNLDLKHLDRYDWEYSMPASQTDDY